MPVLRTGNIVTLPGNIFIKYCQLLCPPAVDTPLIDQAKEHGPRFLERAQKTKKNMISPEQVVQSVEKYLEKGRKFNYPGQARWINLLHGLFPSLLDNIAQRR